MAKADKYGDLRRRLIFLLLALVVYRVGAHIPVPGIDAAQLQQVVEELASRPEPVSVEAMLADRDAQIAELQQAVIELANSTEHQGGPTDPAHDAAIAALHERLGALEARVIEQDRTIRHTLTMLIEWIERDDAQRVAA